MWHLAFAGQKSCRCELIHVSVQGEIPPQQEMKIGGVGGFVPYAATASLVASAMGAPPGMQVGAEMPHRQK